MQEIWVEIDNNKIRGQAIVSISNMGRIKRKNGTIEESTLYQKVWINGNLTLIHRLIAEYFIPKTDEDKELNRDCIDHITHYPTDMNVNDVRNLRWCTHKENNKFYEARYNKSKAKLNKPKSKSEFGRKYYEKYGYSYTENPKQYIREYNYYHRHGKCRWK